MNPRGSVRNARYQLRALTLQDRTKTRPSSTTIEMPMKRWVVGSGSRLPGRAPVFLHPQHDGRAWASREVQRRHARVWVGFDRQNVIHLDLVQRPVGSERVRPDLQRAGFLLGAPRVGIHDGRATAIRLLPAIPVPLAGYETHEAETGLLTDEGDNAPTDSLQV